MHSGTPVPQRRASSRDVAILAGVSQATVSRAFTPGASVAAKTRRRIVDAAAKLGYQPNVIARSLSKNQSKLIGLLFANWSHPKAAELLKGMSEALMAHGYKAVVQSADDDRSVDVVLRDFLQYQVDGVIVFSAAPSAAMSAQCLRNNVPIVLLNYSAQGLGTSSVTINATGIGRQIAAVLLEQSHQRLAIVNSDPGSRVVKGMTRAITDEVAAHPPTLVISETAGVRGYEAGVRAIRELWSKPVKPDAIVCTSDETALGILAGCRHELAIDVPQELAVIGLGDTRVAAWHDHNLSTIRIPHDVMVARTVSALVDQIADPTVEPTLIECDARLILRGTTRAGDRTMQSQEKNVAPGIQ